MQERTLEHDVESPFEPTESTMTAPETPSEDYSLWAFIKKHPYLSTGFVCLLLLILFAPVASAVLVQPQRALNDDDAQQPPEPLLPEPLVPFAPSVTTQSDQAWQYLSLEAVPSDSWMQVDEKLMLLLAIDVDVVGALEFCADYIGENFSSLIREEDYHVLMYAVSTKRYVAFEWLLTYTSIEELNRPFYRFATLLEYCVMNNDPIAVEMVFQREQQLQVIDPNNVLNKQSSADFPLLHLVMYEPDYENLSPLFIKYLSFEELKKANGNDIALLEILMIKDDADNMELLLKKRSLQQRALANPSITSKFSLLTTLLVNKNLKLLKRALPYVTWQDIKDFRSELVNFIFADPDLEGLMLILRRAQEIFIEQRGNNGKAISLQRALSLNKITFKKTIPSAAHFFPYDVARHHPLPYHFPLSISHFICQLSTLTNWVYPKVAFDAASTVQSESHTMKQGLVHLAVMQGEIDHVSYLLEELGLSPSVAVDEVTPLMLSAALHDDLYLFYLLRQYGANITMKDSNGYLASDYACMRGGPYVHSFNHAVLSRWDSTDIPKWAIAILFSYIEFKCPSQQIYWLRIIFTMLSSFVATAKLNLAYQDQFDKNLYSFFLFNLEDVHFALDFLLIFIPAFFMFLEGLAVILSRNKTRDFFLGLEQQLETMSVKQLEKYRDSLKQAVHFINNPSPFALLLISLNARGEQGRSLQNIIEESKRSLPYKREALSRLENIITIVSGKIKKLKESSAVSVRTMSEKDENSKRKEQKKEEHEQRMRLIEAEAIRQMAIQQEADAIRAQKEQEKQKQDAITLREKKEMLDGLCEENREKQRSLLIRLQEYCSQLDKAKGKNVVEFRADLKKLATMKISSLTKSQSLLQLTASITHQHHLAEKLTAIENKIPRPVLPESTYPLRAPAVFTAAQIPTCSSSEQPTTSIEEPAPTISSVASSSRQILPRSATQEDATHDKYQIFFEKRSKCRKKKVGTPLTPLNKIYMSILQQTTDTERLFCLRGWALDVCLALLTPDASFTKNFEGQQREIIIILRHIISHHLNELTREHIDALHRALKTPELKDLPRELEKMPLYQAKKDNINSLHLRQDGMALYYLYSFLEDLQQCGKYREEAPSALQGHVLRFLFTSIGDCWREIPRAEKKRLRIHIPHDEFEYLKNTVELRNRNAHQWGLEFSLQLLNQLPALGSVLSHLKQYLQIGIEEPASSSLPTCLLTKSL